MKKTSNFTSEIEEKTMKKLVAVGITSKIDKMTALGPPFSQKVEFLIDFGDPQGTQKSSPRGESHWGNTLLEPTWDHFRRQTNFFKILAAILGASWPHLGSLRAQFVEKSKHFCEYCWLGWLG